MHLQLTQRCRKIQNADMLLPPAIAASKKVFAVVQLYDATCASTTYLSIFAWISNGREFEVVLMRFLGIGGRNRTESYIFPAECASRFT